MKSAPAQKCLPSEHSTAARNSGCPSSHAQASARSEMSSVSKKLSGGRPISTVATRSPLGQTGTSPNVLLGSGMTAS